MITDEETLIRTVNNLQLQVQSLTQYAGALQNAIMKLSAPTNEAYTTQFYGARMVHVSLPFNVAPGSCNVDVYIDEGGQFRKATPSMSFMGNAIELVFDIPRNGYVVVTGASPGGYYYDLPPMPAPFYPNTLPVPVQSVEAPEQKETPIEVEVSPTVGDYERAMGVIK